MQISLLSQPLAPTEVLLRMRQRLGGARRIGVKCFRWAFQFPIRDRNCEIVEAQRRSPGANADQALSLYRLGIEGINDWFAGAVQPNSDPRACYRDSH